MLLFGVARARARLEGVIAVLEPAELNLLGEPIGSDLFAAAEGIARALHDERRCAQRLQMLHAETVGLARWIFAHDLPASRGAGVSVGFVTPRRTRRRPTVEEWARLLRACLRGGIECLR